MSTLNVGAFIGAGGYGSVYQARWGKRKVAIKKFSVTQDEAQQAAAIQNEIRMLDHLRDRYIIQFYGVTYHSDQLVIIMDYAEGGSLHRAIERRQLASADAWSTKMRIAQEIARGLEYIHHENILHRDLKSANVLLTKHLEVKLCDFGLAMVKVRSVSRSSPSSSALTGTLRWMAPELLVARPKYSTKSDMYALGMVMWEMAANCTMPFMDQLQNSVVAFLIERGEREILPDDTPAEYRAWVERCWDHDPLKRPEASDMVVDEKEDEELWPNGQVTGTVSSTAVVPHSIVSVTEDVCGLTIRPLARMNTLEADESCREECMTGNLAAPQTPLSPQILPFQVPVPPPGYDSQPLNQQQTDPLSMLLSSAENDDAEAQVALAVAYETGNGVPQNDRDSFLWYFRAAQQGHPEAQHTIGRCFFQGRGTQQDEMAAASWFRRAATQGHKVAQRSLGWMYEHGLGIEKSHTQAVSWYRKAAEQGDITAQSSLGWMYQTGIGDSQQKNYDEALSWFRMAATQGDPRAQCGLGFLYEGGKGVEQSLTQAVSWYLKAAVQGDPSGQYNLGWMYEHGRGVPKDMQQALLWYSKAAEGDNEIARTRLKELEEAEKQNSGYSNRFPWLRSASLALSYFT